MSDDPQSMPGTAPEHRILEPGTQVGRFRVEDLLGTGGMGEVYQAWDPTLERSVALKVLRAGEEREVGAPERFRREALALAQLNHPNVCQVHDWVESGGSTYIAMELVPGRTLDQAAPELKTREKLQVIRCVAQALEAAHAKGLVHRDLKPGNIMVSQGPNGQILAVKVLDFGLARLSDPQGTSGESRFTPVAVPNLALLNAMAAARTPGSEETQGPGQAVGARESSSGNSWEKLTQAGSFMGSPSYASPEQIQGQGAGSSSDVFSLGIVAWELLAGEHPFPGEGRSRMQAILDGSRRELKVRGLPSGTSDLLRAMLEVHPFKRPTSAKVAEALERLLRPHSLLRWTAASLVSALVLAGAANWFLGRGVIADLTRQRPARLAVLPFLNQSGDSKHDSLVNAILPEMLEAALREQPKLAPLGQEALGRARKDLRMSPSGPLDSHEEARLSVALGAQLVLHGTLTKGADGALTVKYVLSDARGTVRQSGEVQEPAESVAAPLALARKVSADLIKAVDPFASRTRSQLPGLPAPALEAYAKGMELVEHGDFKAAAPAFLVAAQLAPDFAPAILGYARCMGRTGDGNPEPVLQWARWVARAEGNRSDEMFALQSLSVRLGERGQWDAAEKAGHEAMDLAKNLGRTSFEAVVHLSSGVHLQRQHKRPEAEAEYQRSLAMFQSVDDKLNATRALNNLAVLEKERGNLKAAESRYLAALQFVQEYGDKWGEAVYTNNLGDLALAQEGGLDRAEAAFRKAKSIREAIGDHQGLTYTLMGMASVAQARGDLGRAEDLTKQYLEQARKTGLRPMEALALYNLGELNRASLDYPAARGFYRQSMSMHQELKDAVMEALCLAGEAECMAREKHPGMARVLLDRSLSLSTDETPYLLRAQAWLARSEGRNEEAKALFAKALSTARLQAPEIMKELKEASR